MHYHAKLKYEGGTHYWWNHSKEKMIDSLLVPFVNGQVILINRRGQKSILNLKSVTLLNIYRTKLKLKRSEGGRAPSELKSNELKENDCTEEILGEVRAGQATSSSRSVLQKAFAEPKNQVFVIMKYGDDDLDSAYEGVIKPVMEEQGLKVLRVDEIQDSGKITDQILEQIAQSKYIVADLTGERPNCYYECGFAHALGKELILTVKEKSNIHFDLAGYRFIYWKTESDFRRKLRKRVASLKSGSNL